MRYYYYDVSKIHNFGPVTKGQIENYQRRKVFLLSCSRTLILVYLRVFLFQILSIERVKLLIPVICHFCPLTLHGLILNFVLIIISSIPPIHTLHFHLEPLRVALVYFLGVKLHRSFWKASQILKRLKFWKESQIFVLIIGIQRDQIMSVFPGRCVKGKALVSTELVQTYLLPPQ